MNATERLTSHTALVVQVRGDFRGESGEAWRSLATFLAEDAALEFRDAVHDEGWRLNCWGLNSHRDFQGRDVPRVRIVERPMCTPFGPERAEAIYAERAPFGSLPGITPGEDAYVAAVWRTMPGSTCWMDAFHRIRRGEVQS